MPVDTALRQYQRLRVGSIWVRRAQVIESDPPSYFFALRNLESLPTERGS